MAQQIIGDLVYNLKINKADSIKVLMDLSNVLAQTTKTAEQFGKNLEQATTKTAKGMKMLRQEMSGVSSAMGKLKGVSEEVNKATSSSSGKNMGIWQSISEAIGVVSSSSGGIASTGGALGKVSSQVAGMAGSMSAVEGGIGALATAGSSILPIAAIIGVVIGAVLALKTAIELTVKAVSFLVQKTIEFGKLSLDAYGKLQTAQVSYGALLGSNVAMTDELIAGITKLAVVSPSFSIAEGLDVGKRMMAMGTPPEELVHSMEMLGNVAAATGAPLDRIALVFGQIRAAGKIMGNDWMQLKDAGIPIFELIGDAIGKSADEVMRMKEEGESLDFETVAEAFERATGPGGRFHDMLLKLGLQTLPGLISLFQEFGTVVEQTIGELFGTAFISALQMAGFAIKRLSDEIIDHREEIVESLDFIVEPIRDFGKKFGLGIMKAVAWIIVYKDELLNMAAITWAIISQIGGTLGWLVSAFAKNIMSILGRLFSFEDSTFTISQNIRLFLIGIAMSFNTLDYTIKSILIAMNQWITNFWGVLQAVTAGGLSSILDLIAQWALSAANATAQAGNAMGTALDNAWSGIINAAASAGKAAIDSFFSSWTGVGVKFIGELLGFDVEKELKITVDSMAATAKDFVHFKSITTDVATGIADQIFNVGKSFNDFSNQVKGGYQEYSDALQDETAQFINNQQELERQANLIANENQKERRKNFIDTYLGMLADFDRLFKDGSELPPVAGSDGAGGEDGGGGGSGKAGEEAKKRADAVEKYLEKVLDRVAKFFDNVSVSVENFYDWYDKTFGIGLAGENNLMAPVDAAFANFNTTLTTATEKFEDYKKVSLEVKDSSSDLEEDTKRLEASFEAFNDAIADNEEALKDLDEAVKPVQQEYDDIVEAQGKYNDKIDELTGGKSPLTKAQVAIGDFLTAMYQGNLSTKDLYEVWESSFDEIGDSLEQLTEDHDNMFGEIDDGIKTVIENYDEAKEALEDWQGTTEDLVGDAIDIIMDAHDEIDDLMKDLLSTDDFEKQQEILAKIREQESIINSGEQFQSVPEFSEGLARAEEWAKLNPIDRLIAEFEFENQIRLDQIAEEEKIRQAELDRLQKQIDDEHAKYLDDKEWIESLQTDITNSMMAELNNRENATRASLDRIRAMYDAVADAAKRAFGGGTSGFALGGHTGDGNPMDVAGVVHKGEYVIPNHMVKSNTALINALERQRLGGGQTYNQTVNNYNTISDGADAVLLSNSLAWRLRT